MRANSVLELAGVSRIYGKVPALLPTDLRVEAGEFLTIVGPSGSGKSTLLRLIGGFVAPTAGRILIGGADVTHAAIYDRPCNTVFQDYALFPHMRVNENVAFGLSVRGIPRAQANARVSKILDTVGLSGFEDRYPAQLSGGQRQRVALARAIVCEPKILLLDEPLAALDAELRRQMQTFLKELQSKLGITFLLVTHDQEEAIVVSNRIAVMNKGRIEQMGAPQEIYNTPATEFVATFIGENNLVAGTACGMPTDGFLSIDTGIGRLRARWQSESLVPEGLKLAIRPEFIRVEKEVGGEGVSIPARVESITFIGANTRVSVRPLAAPEEVLCVLVQEQVLPGVSVGSVLSLTWRDEDAVVIAG